MLHIICIRRPYDQNTGLLRAGDAIPEPIYGKKWPMRIPTTSCRLIIATFLTTLAGCASAQTRTFAGFPCLDIAWGMRSVTNGLATERSRRWGSGGHETARVRFRKGASPIFENPRAVLASMRLVILSSVTRVAVDSCTTASHGLQGALVAT